MLPKDILENTVRAFSTSATSRDRLRQPRRTDRPLHGAGERPGRVSRPFANGYGDCGERSLVVTGPRYSRWDLSAVKRTRIVGRTMFEFRADLINAFNHPNFVPVFPTLGGHANNADNYRVTGVQENSSRVIQLVTRFSVLGAARGREVGGWRLEDETRSEASDLRPEPPTSDLQFRPSHIPSHPNPRISLIQKAVLDATAPLGLLSATRGIVRPSTAAGGAQLTVTPDEPTS